MRVIYLHTYMIPTDMLYSHATSHAVTGPVTQLCSHAGTQSRSDAVTHVKKLATPRRAGENEAEQETRNSNSATGLLACLID